MGELPMFRWFFLQMAFWQANPMQCSYINKMSNYCVSCRYKVAKKNGPDACPFNYLYWDFLARNREKLAQNPRVSMMYRTYDRMGEDKRQAISDDSRHFLKCITP